MHNAKKKFFFFVFIITIQCIAILSILAYLVFVAPGTGNKPADNYIVPVNSTPIDTLYNIKADIEVSGNIVNITQDIKFESPQSKIYAYIPSANHAITTLKKITVDGMYKDSIIDSMNLSIVCDKPQNSISLEYELKLDSNRQTLSYSDSYILLTNFLITPAVMKDGKPIQLYKSSFGDPYIYNMNNYEISIKADKGYNVFGPGQKGDKVSGSYRTAAFKAINLRDFPIVLAKNPNVKSEKHGNSTVYYINSYSARNYVNEALTFAEKNIGAYPYKELFVVNAPISSNEGMEQSQMILISDRCFNNGNDLRGVTYHEIFHQWFYNIIGTNQLDEPFLDEGLVNYLSIILGGGHPSTFYDSSFLNMHLNNYSSRDQYMRLAYVNAAQYYSDIHKKMGNGFFKTLKKIYNDKKNSILYYKDFLKYIN